MSTIREVVRALGQREGVDAVLMLGRDGLPIDSVCSDAVDADNIAALVPTAVGAFDRVGDAAARGKFSTAVLEGEGGYMIVKSLTPDILLAVFVSAHTNIGPLLYELRRYEAAITSLI